MNALASPLPPVRSTAGNVPAVVNPSSATAGISFNETARLILAADASGDTATALADALRLGEHEFQIATASLSNARRVATDPLASDDEANAARSEIAGLTATVERIEAAWKMLTARHTAFVERSKAERVEAEWKAALDRHAAAVEAIRARYSTVADELAGMFAELVAATRECERLRIPCDGAIAGRLGIVGAMGTLGIVHLPKLDAGTHWPVEKTPEERRAIARMMSGKPWED